MVKADLVPTVNRVGDWLLLFMILHLAWLFSLTLHEIGHAAAYYGTVENVGVAISAGPHRGSLLVARHASGDLAWRLVPLLACFATPLAFSVFALLPRKRNRWPHARLLVLATPCMGLLQLAMTLPQLGVFGRSRGDLYEIAQLALPRFDALRWGSLIVGLFVFLFMGAIVILTVVTRREFPTPMALRTRFTALSICTVLILALSAVLGALDRVYWHGIAACIQVLILGGIGSAAIIVGRRLEAGILVRWGVGYCACMLVALWTVYHPVGLFPVEPSVPERGVPGVSARDPGSFDELVLKAEEFDESGEYMAAASCWASARALSPTQSYLAYREGVSLFRVGSLRNAESALERASEMLRRREDLGNDGLPKHIEHWLGRIAYAEGRWRDACGHFQLQLRYGWTTAVSDISADPRPFIQTLGQECDSSQK
jgi:tetratricopeptide (TPR) repeat protein